MEVYIKDGSFTHQQSMTLGGDNKDQSPFNFTWSRRPCGSKFTFYTDMLIDQAKDDDGRKVAILLEPPSLSDTHYNKAEKLQDHLSLYVSETSPELHQF